MTKKYYLITSNNSKYQEILKIFKLYNLSLKRINFDIPEIKSLSPKKVVIDKIVKAFRKYKRPIFVDDTSIFFNNYKYFPGTLSRFIFKSLGYNGLLKLYKNNQKAHFTTYIAYIDSTLSKPKIFTGNCNGTLIKKILGIRRIKMPYDNIFIPAGERKTFAQLGILGKQKYDHRSKAIRKLIKYLKASS